MRTIRLAAYSVDPPALDSFHSFDPESFIAISLIADSLVYFDTEGAPQPALATRWERTSPVTLELELRRGVTFHDGSPFDADSVVATFAAHMDETTPSMTGKGMLSAIKSCTKLDDFRVRIESKFPDALLLRRLYFSQIYPAHVLRSGGIAAVGAHPIGTGAYKLVRWEKGRQVVLARNVDHWAQRATVEEIILPIRKQKEWVDGLNNKEIDIAINIDAHDAARLESSPDVRVHHEPAAMSHWFLLADKGPLADVRVRRALNYAVHRRLLAEVSEHGYATPQAGITTRESEGFHPELKPYRYAPDLARRLLKEAGHERLVLRGLVSETSISLYLAVREFLARVGVTLEGEVVPRGEWLKRVVGGRASGAPYDGDFALMNVDNPVQHGLFHHFIFFFSHGPFSLMHSKGFDEMFMKAATVPDAEAGTAPMRALEQYVHDEALCLFTVQQEVFAATRPGYSIPIMRSGHFNNAALWDMAAPDVADQQPWPPPTTPADHLEVLLDATSHSGLFYMRPGARVEDPALQRLWRNIDVSQERWLVQQVPMLRELVAQVDARSNLANVLQSTERMAIVGYDVDGRRLFVNAGYKEMIGDEQQPLTSLLDHDQHASVWQSIKSAVDAQGAWVGPVDVQTSAGRRNYYLTATQAHDEQGAAVGYTLVLSDFSGEEERIKSGAIRTILEHVPFGLLRVDATLSVLPGYSTACDRLLTRSGAAILGKPLAELLGLTDRERDHFNVVCAQIFDDVLPDEVAVGQLPERLRVGQRVLGVSASPVRDSDGAITSVLFSIADVTALDDAERETARVHGVLQVLRYRERFADFVVPLLSTLQRLVSSSNVPQEEARRELHTAKGVLGQFQLVELARLIHEVEEAPRIGVDELVAVRDAVTALLAGNVDLWGIRPEQRRQSVQVDLDELEALEAAVAASPAEALQLVRRFHARAQQQTVATMAGPLGSLVAQLGTRLGKDVGFDLVGGDLRIPRSLGPVFEAITHLVRNAVDHGIEADRGSKPARATVQLSVHRLPRGYQIAVSDDGRGIDVDRVVQKALASGMTTPAAVEAMTASERLALVLRDGVSTADDVTDLSGRGVGTSAVVTVVEQLGGHLEIASSQGCGTTFTMVIPDEGTATAAIEASL